MLYKEKRRDKSDWQEFAPLEYTPFFTNFGFFIALVERLGGPGNSAAVNLLKVLRETNDHLRSLPPNRLRLVQKQADLRNLNISNIQDLVNNSEIDEVILD